MAQIRAALDEKRALAQLLKKRLDRILPTGQEPAVTELDAGPTRTRPILRRSNSVPLSKLVERAVMQLGDQEFVVSNVSDAMRQAGATFSENVNSRITNVLARLESRGVIERTSTGGGNVPNKYRRRPQQVTIAAGDESNVQESGVRH